MASWDFEHATTSAGLELVRDTDGVLEAVVGVDALDPLLDEEPPTEADVPSVGAPLGVEDPPVRSA